MGHKELALLNLGTADLLRQIEQYLEAAKEKNLSKKWRSQLIVFGRIDRIASGDAILLVLWMKRHIAIALNFYCDIVVKMIFWLFL